LSKFKLETLYNFSIIAHNNLGYKHTKESKLKVSKKGNLNPMFGKIHSEETKDKMRKRKNKYPLGVVIWDLEGNLISKFENNVELAKYLKISKVTVGKYLNTNLLYVNSNYFRPIMD
jgi:group I intron endonuclease